MKATAIIEINWPLLATVRGAANLKWKSTTPPVAGRQLFLRSNRNLYCIQSVQTAGAGKTR